MEEPFQILLDQGMKVVIIHQYYNIASGIYKVDLSPENLGDKNKIYHHGLLGYQGPGAVVNPYTAERHFSRNQIYGETVRFFALTAVMLDEINAFLYSVERQNEIFIEKKVEYYRKQGDVLEDLKLEYVALTFDNYRIEKDNNMKMKEYEDFKNNIEQTMEEKQFFDSEVDFDDVFPLIHLQPLKSTSHCFSYTEEFDTKNSFIEVLLHTHHPLHMLLEHFKMIEWKDVIIGKFYG